MLVVWLGWALAQEAEVACPDNARAVVVTAASDVAASWFALDEVGYARARRELDGLVGCVTDALNVEEAVVLHRAHAISAFVEGDAEASRRAFAAVRILAPAWTPPADKVPPEHPLWKLWATSVDASKPIRSLPLRVLPENGWSVDGTRFSPDTSLPPPGLPLDRAFVLQVFDAQEHAKYTGYHLSLTDVPVDQVAILDDPRIARERRNRQAHVWGSVVGGTLLAGAATAFGLGWNDRQHIVNEQTPVADAQAVAGRANTLGGVSYGLAGAGALALTVAWTVNW